MGGFVPLSAGLVLPCLMKIRNLARAGFLPNLTSQICQITELLQSSRSTESATGARLQLRLQAQIFATHSSFLHPENNKLIGLCGFISPVQLQIRRVRDNKESLANLIFQDAIPNSEQHPMEPGIAPWQHKSSKSSTNLTSTLSYFTACLQNDLFAVAG